MDNTKMVSLQEVLDIIDKRLIRLDEREAEEEKWNAWIDYRPYQASRCELYSLKERLIEIL